jgi:hypothetical protein
MNRFLARVISVIVMGAGLLLSPARSVAAETNAPSAEDLKLVAEDKEACIRNLKLIYEAIQAYRADHKELPNWLSDLVPQYINDANILICPACKRTGQSDASALSDPKIPSSYFFEFCPVPLGPREVPNGLSKTRREWKRRQMGLAGSVVPIVRCWHHPAVLNLAFDGKIYESPPNWETLLTNEMNVAELTPGRIFADDPKAGGSAKPASVAPVLTFQQRGPEAKPGLINLSDYYNAMLTESWHGNANNDLKSLPTGLQTFAGVEFDVRGIIQLGSKSEPAKRFPPQVKGIKVGQKCQRLEFLHATAFAGAMDEGKQVGSYLVHFATNNMQLEIPIYCGRDVRDWHANAEEKPGAKELTVAWTGSNAVSKTAGSSIRLFKTTWENVAPGVEIESIDYISSMGKPAPFLIAITAE